MPSPRALLPAALALALIAAGCGPAVPVPDFPDPPTPAALLSVSAPARTAADVVGDLTVSQADVGAPRYDRDTQFGSGWRDTDGDGCDTREEILARDAAAGRLDADGCAADVVIGDPYTGALLPERAVDIDHVVALGDAWRKGARYLSQGERVALANDPENLLAVSARENRSKGDDDAAAWLPPVPAADCPYVARQAAVKTRYRLWVTPQERAAMLRTLDRCPGYPALASPR